MGSTTKEIKDPIIYTIGERQGAEHIKKCTVPNHIESPGEIQSYEMDVGLHSKGSHHMVKKGSHRSSGGPGRLKSKQGFDLPMLDDRGKWQRKRGG